MSKDDLPGRVVWVAIGSAASVVLYYTSMRLGWNPFYALMALSMGAACFYAYLGTTVRNTRDAPSAGKFSLMVAGSAVCFTLVAMIMLVAENGSYLAAKLIGAVICLLCYAACVVEKRNYEFYANRTAADTEELHPQIKMPGHIMALLWLYNLSPSIGLLFFLVHGTVPWLLAPAGSLALSYGLAKYCTRQLHIA